MKKEFSGYQPRTSNVYVGQPKKVVAGAINKYLVNGHWALYKSEARKRELGQSSARSTSPHPAHYLQQSILVREDDETDNYVKLSGYAAAAYRNTAKLFNTAFSHRNIDNKTAILVHHITTH